MKYLVIGLSLLVLGGCANHSYISISGEQGTTIHKHVDKDGSLTLTVIKNK